MNTISDALKYLNEIGINTETIKRIEKISHTKFEVLFFNKNTLTFEISN